MKKSLTWVWLKLYKSSYKNESWNFHSQFKSKQNSSKRIIDFNFGRHYTIIDFNEVDMRLGRGEYHF